jgi:hypothetical protein
MKGESLPVKSSFHAIPEIINGKEAAIMSDRRAVLSLVCALIVSILALSCNVCSARGKGTEPEMPGQAEEAIPARRGWTSPSIPLPDLELEDIEVPNWSDSRVLPNSTRAWHYNPDLVRPLLEVADAVDSPILDFKMRRMLIAVVASRNGCFY